MVLDQSLAGRAVRVSVAEPRKSPLVAIFRLVSLKYCRTEKERSGFGGGGFDDDAKFAGNWRRDGPLPDQNDSRDGPRRRYDSTAREPPPPSVSESASDWRSSRVPARASSTLSQESDRRAGPPRSREAPPPGPADTEDVWKRGAKLRPSPSSESTERPGSRFGSLRREPAPGAAPTVTEESDWRGSRTISRNSTSRTFPIALSSQAEF